MWAESPAQIVDWSTWKPGGGVMCISYNRGIVFAAN